MNAQLPMLEALLAALVVIGGTLGYLAAVLLRGVLTRALDALRSLPQWCSWRIQVEQRGPSARLVNTVRALIAAGVR